MMDVQQLLKRLENKFDVAKFWQYYQMADSRKKRELEDVIRAIAAKEGLNTYDDTITLPPPKKEESEGDITFGNVIYPNAEPYPYSAHLRELTRHVGIFASTGWGKTTIARNIIRDLASHDIPFLIIDWEKSYRHLAKEIDGVKVFTIARDVAPFRFNFFKLPPGLAYQDYVKEIVTVFSAAYLGGAGADNILRKIFDQAYQYQKMPTLSDVEKILVNETAPSKMRGREMNWKQSVRRMIEFLCYGKTGDTFNTHCPEGIEHLFKGQVVLELGGLSNEYDKQFTVMIILLWYWRYLEHQGIEDEKLKHIILLEEFHKIAEVNLIIEAFRMLRKYGTGIIALDQMPSSIPKDAFENMGTKIVFSLDLNDNVRAVANAMYMTKEEANYIGLLRKGEAIVRSKERYAYPFLISVPFTGNPASVTDDELKEYMKPYLQLSRPSDLLDDWCPTLQSPPIDESPPTPGEIIMLSEIGREPFLGTDERYKKLGLSARLGTEYKNNLINKGYIQPVNVDGKILFDLKPKAREFLDVKNIKIPTQARGGIQHNYWLEKIKEKFKSTEKFPFKEKDDIDLVVEAYDFTWLVQVETGKSNIKKNIETLIKSRADRRIMVATNKQAEFKIINIISRINLPGIDNVETFFVKDFLSHPLTNS